MCGDIGWVLDTNARVEPLGLELLPCLLPDCHWSGRAIATLSVDGRFRDVVRHPKDGRGDGADGVRRTRTLTSPLGLRVGGGSAFRPPSFRANGPPAQVRSRCGSKQEPGSTPSSGLPAVARHGLQS
jgi:hypothetical protein